MCPTIIAVVFAAFASCVHSAALPTKAAAVRTSVKTGCRHNFNIQAVGGPHDGQYAQIFQIPSDELAFEMQPTGLKFTPYFHHADTFNLDIDGHLSTHTNLTANTHANIIDGFFYLYFLEDEYIKAGDHHSPLYVKCLLDDEDILLCTNGQAEQFQICDVNYSGTIMSWEGHVFRDNEPMLCTGVDLKAVCKPPDV